MHKAIVIGNLGADAVEQKSQGQSFISFRVATTERYSSADGQRHEVTDWIDCTMNGVPSVFPYLKKGTTVCVIGDERLRIYSSAKERRMKAGAQIFVRSCELIGGRADTVPSRLYDANGVQHDVNKFYFTDCHDTMLYSMSGQAFVVQSQGWVTPSIAASPALDADSCEENQAADDAPFTGQDGSQPEDGIKDS